MPNTSLEYTIAINTRGSARDIQLLTNRIQALSGDLRISSSRVDQVDQNINQLTSSMGDLKTVLAGVVGSFVAFEALDKVVTVSGDFEEIMDRLGAISQATATEFEKLRAKAIELGESTKYSSVQIAEGMTFLAMSGMDAEKQIASIEATLNLASIGNIELAESADFASNVLSMFGLEASQMEDVVDTLAVTITNSNTDITQMAEAMKYVGSQAKVMGLDVAEVSTALGILGNNGLQGSIAGTTLNQTLLRMATYTPKAKDALNRLGISFFDAEGKFIGLEKALIKLKISFKDLSDQQKITATKDIFGVEATKGLLSLVANIGGEYDKLADKLEDRAGASQKMVKQMTDNYNNAVLQMKSALDTLFITIGGDLLPVLTTLTKESTEVIKTAKEWYEEYGTLAGGIAKLIIELYALKKIIDLIKWGSLATGVTTFAQASAYLSATALPALRVAFVALRTAIMAINPILAIGTGLIIASELALSSWAQEIANSNTATKSLQNQTLTFGKTVRDINKNLNNATMEYKLTQAEIDKNTLSLKNLMIENQKLIDKWKEKDPELYAQQIAGLEKQNNSLSLVYERVANTEPYTEIEEKVKSLGKEQTKYINKLIETNQRRESATTITIANLSEKEKKLNDDLKNLEEQLYAIRQNYNNKRILLEENYSNKLKSLQDESLTDPEKYYQNQIDAAENYNKAILALKNENFALSKSYLDKYNNLIDEYAGQEISIDDDVYISKKQNLEDYEKSLSKAKELDLILLNDEKNKQIEIHNTKINHKIIELKALQSQILAQTQILKLTKQILEISTGESIAMDFGSTQKNLEDITGQIENLKTQLKMPVETNLEIKSNINKVLTEKELLEIDTESIHKIKIQKETIKSGVEFSANLGVEGLLGDLEKDIEIPIKPKLDEKAMNESTEKIKKSIDNVKSYSTGSIEDTLLFYQEALEKTSLKNPELVGENELEIYRNSIKRTLMQIGEDVVANNPWKYITTQQREFAQSSVDTNQQRLTDSTTTIRTMKQNETTLIEDLKTLEAGLQTIRNDYASQRVTLAETYDLKLQNLRDKDLSKLKQYEKVQADAEIAKQKANEAIAQKKFDDAKKYLDEYNGLIDEYAGQEIEIDGVVHQTKMQSLEDYELQLQEAKKIDLELLAAEEQKLMEIQNQKIIDKQIELEATKAQIIAQERILYLVEAILAKTTGAEIAFDFEPTKKSIEAIDKQIDNLQSKLKSTDSGIEVSSTPKKMAKGGLVTGGIKGQDSVPALLEPGEYVLPKQIVDNLGRDTIENLGNFQMPSFQAPQVQALQVPQSSQNNGTTKTVHLKISGSFGETMNLSGDENSVKNLENEFKKFMK